MINKLEFKDNEAITLYPDDIKIVNKINEIIDYLNSQEQIRTEVAIQDIKKDIERAKIEAINNSQMAMLNGRV